MSKSDRGVYQPPSDTLELYDPVEDDEEERSRLPLLIVVALLVLAAFTGVVWLAYSQGVESGRTGAPVIVSAPTGPVKTAGDSASGETPYAGLKVYDKPVPPDEEAESSTLAPAPPPPPADASPAPVTQNQPPPPPEVRLGEGAPDKAPAAAAPPPPAAAPAKVTAIVPPPVVAHAPVKVAPPKAAPPAVAAPKATQPPAALQHPAAATLASQTPPSAALQHSAAATLASQAPAQAAVQAPPQPKTTLAAAPPIPPELAAHPAPARAAVGGGAMLQIGAYESEDLAKGAWNAFQAKHAGSLAGATSDIQRADLGPKGIWYRLRVGPFADKAAANATCDKLKAEGAGCFAAAP